MARQVPNQATIAMALGGWMSGAIFDLTGSYHAAFLNGPVWNFLNMAIAASMIVRRDRRLALAVNASPRTLTSRIFSLRAVLGAIHWPAR